MRKTSNQTLSELSAATKIQRSILEAFEEGRYDALPESLYARQFLKRYVRALGGDEAYFLHRFEEERGTCDFIGNARLPIKKTRVRTFFSLTRLSKLTGLLLLIVSVGTYMGWQIITITAPPNITLESPLDNSESLSGTVLVIGKTEPETKLDINGAHIPISVDGHFSVPIALERGANVITIEGATRHSRTNTVYRRVIFVEPDQKPFLGR